MDNENIKEILQTLDGIASGDWIQMLPKEASLLLDYITNLQEENERLEKRNIYYINNEKKLLSDWHQEHNEAIEYKSRNEKARKLLNRHDIDTGDIYYKYNNRFVKSELKERIREILGGDEE